MITPNNSTNQNQQQRYLDPFSPSFPSNSSNNPNSNNNSNASSSPQCNASPPVYSFQLPYGYQSPFLPKPQQSSNITDGTNNNQNQDQFPPVYPYPYLPYEFLFRNQGVQQQNQGNSNQPSFTYPSFCIPYPPQQPQQQPSHTSSNINVSYIKCPITPQQKKCLQMSFSSFITNHLENPKQQSEQILKICNHPILFKAIKPDYTTDFNSSGKMIILDKLLSKLKKEEQKVILFANINEILEIIKKYLISKNYPFNQFDSSVRGEKRQKEIDEFHSTNSFFVFLCNFKSGLNGINMSNTDYVIIYDCNESTNCIVNKLKNNGLGQTKKVEIIRLVTSQSYEQVILNYIDKDQEIDFTHNIEKFLRFGAYFALKKSDNIINKDDDVDLTFSSSLKIHDINELIDYDIESPVFWQTIVQNNNYFNPINYSFEKSLNSQVYVDKSEMIYHINKLLGTEQKCLCVTRPRRFGKTMAAKMLSAYYSKGCDSSELFAGSKGSKTDGFYDHLNKHNVIYIDIQMFALSYNGNSEDLFSFIQTKILEEMKLTFPYIKNDILIYAIEETKQKFIIIIDEWDVIYKNYKDNEDIQSKYIKFLVPLTKGPIADNQIELVYMTGILPIKKHGINSSLNAFIDCTMLNPIFMAPYTGFTGEEVRTICDKNNFDFNEMKEWYDGYILSGFHMYNPKSIVDAIISRKIGNYWAKTGSFESLKYYINMNFDQLRYSMTEMLAGNSVKIDINSFQNDLDEIKNKDDIFTILAHIGYLAFDETKNEVFIPNKELMSVFYSIIKECNWDVISDAIKQSEELLSATLSMNEDKVAEIIGKVHNDSTSLLKYNDENSLSCVISIAYYSAKRIYFIVRELPLGIGFSDFAFIPKPGTNKPAILFELKWNKDAETAIKQIEQKKYSGTLSEFTSNLIIVGVNYDKIEKKYQCIIKKYKR
ncbi:hypothetical protein M9Y10_018323 [Tritrichomonas musculus]|uniref:Helicase C-terminal domain-containing protein n=1 Tax=Tritrichomonas musculus TaxID=1915356 RepID=A0ABR2HNI1_9EUKA